jgi:hypothetical protein
VRQDEKQDGRGSSRAQSARQEERRKERQEEDVPEKPQKQYDWRKYEQARQNTIRVRMSPEEHSAWLQFLENSKRRDKLASEVKSHGESLQCIERRFQRLLQMTGFCEEDLVSEEDSEEDEGRRDTPAGGGKRSSGKKGHLGSEAETRQEDQENSDQDLGKPSSAKKNCLGSKAKPSKEDQENSDQDVAGKGSPDAVRQPKKGPATLN